MAALHAGDLVVVITGKDKGKTGRIMRILSEKGRVIVEGVNMRVRHLKKTPQKAGQIVRYEGAIHRSNVMFIDPKTKKRTRIGIRNEGAKKWRFAKRSGVQVEKGRGEKTVVRSTSAEEKETEKDIVPKKKEGAEKGPERQPFWKRALRTKEGGEKEGGEAPHDRQEDYDRSSAHNIQRSRESS